LRVVGLHRQIAAQLALRGRIAAERMETAHRVVG
jgi:hypothetical protein